MINKLVNQIISQEHLMPLKLMNSTKINPSSENRLFKAY